MEGRCLDVIEIDGASNNSVEQVRDLRDECQYAPSQCRFKIYVIDEVHMLSQQAFNALLKTLEEPPPHVKFVFATTESNKVLPTIVSRCQRFEFRSIPSPLIVCKLQEICQAEGIEADQEALEAIARMAMGGMRDAQSILDQMISFCGKVLKPEDVLDVYGLAAAHQIKDLGGAILDADYDKILASTGQFAEMGLDFYRALLDLSEYFREKLLSSLSGEGDSLEIYPEQITRVLDALQNGESLVKLGLSEKANFEVTLFRAVESARSKSIDQVIRRITQTIPEGAKKKSPKPEVKQASQSVSGKVAEPSPDIPEENTQRVETQELDAFSESKAPDSGEKDQEMPVDLDVTENSEKERQVGAQSPQPVDTSKKREDALVNDLRITDPDVIEQRVKALPAEIRKIVEEDFKGEYVAVEKIDSDKLI